MSINLPTSLAGDQGRALQLLHAYYGQPFGGPGTRSGAAFDLWDSTGTRERGVDVFTADDLVAVSLLAVQVPGPAARVLLVDQRLHFSELLAQVGPDRDLASVRQPFDDDGPEWALQRALTDLEGVGQTTASKLYARKRPRLRPIYDAVVSAVLGTQLRHWEPIRQALQPSASGDLHQELIWLRAAAGLPEQVSTLRILDVAVWMEGKGAGLGKRVS
jgi:hypothetical protein